jgi:small redox-active disulfide protein 2
MKIEILGIGCPKCKKTTNVIKEAIQEAGLKAEIVHITDLNEIVKHGVMMTPAIMLDGEIKSSGRVPSLQEVKFWLE